MFCCTNILCTTNLEINDGFHAPLVTSLKLNKYCVVSICSVFIIQRVLQKLRMVFTYFKLPTQFTIIDQPQGTRQTHFTFSVVEKFVTLVLQNTSSMQRTETCYILKYNYRHFCWSRLSDDGGGRLKICTRTL